MKPTAARIRGSWSRWVCAAVTTGAVLGAGGCATPARPDRASPAGRLSIAAPAALNGEYDVTFHSLWVGPMRTRMTAQPTPAGFKANTEPGVAWNLVGGLQAVLGPLLAPYLFPQGMLLVWETSLPDPATGRDGEGWIGISTIGAFRAKTRTPAAGGPTRIELADGRTLAVVETTPASPIRPPTADYARLLENMESIASDHLAESRRDGRADLQGYFADLRTALPHVHDDVTFAFACGLAWRKHPGLPLPIAYPKADTASTDLLRRVGGALSPINLSRDPASGIVTVEAYSLDSVAEIDATMAAALSPAPAGLILDLRNTAASDLAALRIAAWLLETPCDAGCFFSGAAKTGAPPRGDERRITLGTIEEFEHADRELRAAGSGAFTVEPVRNGFRGPVAVLISGRTRSVAEVLVRMLAASGRVTTVGERTAGKARLHTERDIGDGYVVRWPEFDWVSAKGEQISRGVVPSVKATAEDAARKAAAIISHAPPASKAP